MIRTRVGLKVLFPPLVWSKSAVWELVGIVGCCQLSVVGFCGWYGIGGACGGIIAMPPKTLVGVIGSSTV